MRAVKETVRKYYKYNYTSWTQPTLSSNGTMGGDSFACSATSEYSSDYAAWKAFDGNTGTLYYSVNNVYGELLFYNPIPLKITNLKFTNRNSGNISAIATGEIYGSSDGSNWILLNSFSNSSTSASSQWSITINADSYKYFKIKPLSFGSHSTANTSIAELAITANQQSAIESTSSDYDFYKDVDVYKLPKIDNTYYGVQQ